MFIELTTERDEKVMVNLDNVRLITEYKTIHFNSGHGGSDTLRIKESYDEIKLKMAGR